MTRLAAVAPGDSITSAIENADRTGINKTMQLVTPTSVSTGSIGTYGAVTISAASAVSVNGCFTSEFDWYVVEYALSVSAAAAIGMVLRGSGTDATSAYDSQRLNTVSTTVAGAQSLNTGNFVIDPTSIAGMHFGTVKLYGPALAGQTVGIAHTGMAANPMTSTNAGLYIGALSHRTTSGYDGFTLSVSSGNMTGSIRVYGII